MLCYYCCDYCYCYEAPVDVPVAAVAPVLIPEAEPLEEFLSDEPLASLPVIGLRPMPAACWDVGVVAVPVIYFPYITSSRMSTAGTCFRPNFAPFLYIFLSIYFFNFIIQIFT